MNFKERTFICKKDHVSKYWAWDNEYSIPCRTQRCKLKANRSLPGSTRYAQNTEPFVYYERPSDGEIFIAATNTDTRRPKGFVKREVRTMRDYEQFRRRHTERLKSEADLNYELDRQDKSRFNSLNRESLKAMMSSLSPEGREFAQAAIERSYAADNPPRQQQDCFITGIENDRSNREPHNDESSNWKRRD